MFHRLWQYRDLFRTYVGTQYRLRYRQSFIGVAWAVIPTLATLGVGIIVFHKVAKIDTGDVPYPLFTMSALIPWSFFASSMNGGINSISSAQSIVTRLPFPRAILPLCALGISLIDISVTFGLFVIFTYGYGRSIPITALWFPFLLLVEIGFTSGLVFLGSALNMFARDIRTIVPLAVQMWLFITPVMYPLDKVPEQFHALYLLNPMTGIVESVRDVLVYGTAPRFDLLIPAVVGAVFFLVVGTWYFRITEPRFADVI